MPWPYLSASRISSRRLLYAYAKWTVEVDKEICDTTPSELWDPKELDFGIEFTKLHATQPRE